MKSLRISLSLCCVLLCLNMVVHVSPVLALEEETCEYPAIFNFGDSNSDTGAISAAFSWSPPPNGESFFPRPAGRYSDGRLVIDFLANSLGKPFLRPYLNSLGSNFSYGANFANSAATITPPDYMMPRFLPPHGWSPFYLYIQYNQFIQFIERSQLLAKKGGVFKDLLPKKEYFSKALYTIDIGQNDIGMGFFTNKSIEAVNASVPDMVNSLSTHIKNIYILGARTFWIHNTGPIGCLPYILTNFPVTAEQTDSAGCSRPHNEVSQYFNYKLKESVYQLRKDLPLASITLVDIYSVKYSLYKEPAKYGFKNQLVACCGYGGKYNFGNVLCKGTITVSGRETPMILCKRPQKRLSWDGIHFTQAAHKIVFEKIITGAFSDPPNTPPSMACHKFST